MNREFIPCEQALALKELGFDEPCFTSYDDEGDLRNPFDYSNSEYDHNRRYIGDTKNFVYNSELTIENFNGNKDLYTQFIAAPLYQQAFKFFREKHELYSFISKEHLGFTYALLDGTYGFHIISFDTYEEAELACLKKLIELVKNKQS